ncbi:MAG: trigger factor [Bacillota bacterium]|nr:trigger factor [Bacillota bacterium]
MKVSASSQEDGHVLLEIEVEPERVDAAVQATYRRLVRKVSVPGFRPGKAPLAILDRHLGKGYIERQALEDVASAVYRQAVAQAGLDPVGRPEVSLKEYRQGQPLLVEARVLVRPEPEIGDLDDIHLEPIQAEVDAAEVDREIDRIRYQHATLVAVEDDRVRPGDRVVVDWELRQDDSVVASGNSREADVPGAPWVAPAASGGGEGAAREGGPPQGLAGASGPPPSALEGLVGAAPGETRGAGGYRMTLREIRRPEFPELDDEFARQAGGFSSLQEMREQIENSLRGSRLARIRQEREAQITDELLRRCRVDVPEPLVEEELEGLLGRYRHAAGGSLPAETEADLRVQLRPMAERSARLSVILETIARREGLLPTEQEMEPLLRKVVRPGETLAQARGRLEEMGVWRDLELSMARGKALATLVDRATRGECHGVSGTDGGGTDGQGGEGL